MADDAESVLAEFLFLKEEVERQRLLIEELTRPRHWTQDGPRGAQATAIHHALDRVLERAVKLRDVVRPGRSSPFDVAEDAPEPPPPEPYDGFFLRVRQAADLLGGVADEGPALDVLLAAADRSHADMARVAWLSAAAALGRYPHLDELHAAQRALRAGGVEELGELLRTMHLEAAERGALRPELLAVRRGAVVVDVTHTARNDLHTGIQRVVRELGARWLGDDRTVLVWWDDERECLRELGLVETFRFRNWEDHLPDDEGTAPIVRDFGETPPAIVVPWDSAFVLPELAADHRRSNAYVGLVTSGVPTHLGVIGFDLVPVTASETVHEGMVGVFNTHLSVVKHARRLSAISETAANEFCAFGQALRSQGLVGPEVAAHPLPPTPYEIVDSELDALRSELALGDDPIVLVVGSREPRKNQITVLEAARHLWRDGRRFHLVMVGGSGWNAAHVNDEIERLQASGNPITVRTRASDTELFAWYRLARFSVFPSIYEGFGLPIVESLGVGTPVITSDYGAMSEVASPGGALLVDPRDPESVRSAMERLLDDDDLLAELSEQALNRAWPTWDDYAEDVWRHLVDVAPHPSAH